tara:strand:+ start:833 stop:1522 length:690 start_codon:yes stop_codon:yes gene_type:complete
MSTLKVDTILSADTPTVNFTDGINVSGIVTASSFGEINVGSAVTISGNGNVATSGIVTATQFQGGGLTIDAGNGDTGLSMDVAGSGNYVIKESSSDDVMQYGSGASSCYKHNFSSGMVSVNNGHGSVADFYPCRGWCNISGDSSPAAVIRRSSNFSAITDNGSGDYTLTFTNAMPDSQYAFTMCRARNASQDGGVIAYGTKSTTQIRTRSWKENFTGVDDDQVCVMIFR